MKYKWQNLQKRLIPLVAFSGMGAATVLADSEQKNVLMIIVDDLLPQLGCYGDIVKSPNIDALAAEGVLFERSYCQKAICTASRVSFLTGQLPDRHFEIGWNPKMMRTVNPETVSLPQYFKQKGYLTQGTGKVFDFRTIQGFDSESWSGAYYSNDKLIYPAEFGRPDGDYQGDMLKKRRQEEQGKYPGYQQVQHFKKLGLNPATQCLDVPDDALMDGALANYAVEFIKEQAGSNKQKPFFLAVGFIKPHLPFVAPKKYWDMYNPADFDLAALQDYPVGAPEVAQNNYHEIYDYSGVPAAGPFSKEFQQHLRHGYAAATSYTDAQIGKVIQALKDSGLWDTTTIVLLGDNGYFLGDKGEWGKHSNYEQAARIPLIIRTPGIQGGKKTASLVELVDIFPTLCELTGLETPKNLDGKSLVPVMKDPNTEIKSVARSEFNRPCVMGYAVRNAEYRYVEWREQGDKHLVSEVTGIIVGKELYYYGTNGDVAHGEARNLADSPEYKDVVLKMQAELDKAFPYLPQRIGELKDIPKPTSQQNSSELWNAVKNGDLKQAQTLLEQGTAANSFDPGGMHNSCIAQAVRNKNAKMVSLLLKHGANMHQRNFWQQTAWSECINAGSDEIMSLLKDARSKERYN